MENQLQATTGNQLSANSMTSPEVNRAIAQVQVQVMMAKQFPRNQIQALQSIKEACKRIRLAENAIYSYPRGGQRIEGPSIRLAEMIAQNWGNIDFGVNELERRPGRDKEPGESLVMAFCIDYQTNTRRQTTFTIPHVRYSRNKGNTPLIDPRDVDEMILNKAARRLRACIMAIIPGDIIDEAVEQCNRTLKGNNDKPLPDRIRNMMEAFQELGVRQEVLEKYLGWNMDACIESDIVRLGKIYKSLKDGMSRPEDWFEMQSSKNSNNHDKKPNPKFKLAEDVESAPKSEPTPESKPEEPPPVSKSVADLFEWWQTEEGQAFEKRMIQEKTWGDNEVSDALNEESGELAQRLLDHIKMSQ